MPQEQRVLSSRALFARRLWLLGFAGVLTAATPSPSPDHVVPSEELHRGTVTRFGSSGPISIQTRMVCGPGGDIYAVYSSNSSPATSSTPLRRVSVTSRTVTEYPVPAIPGYENLARLTYDVSPDGSLFALLQANPQSASKGKSERVWVYLVVKYKNDGQMDTYFPLGDMPGKHIGPQSLAVFADGNLLISGTTVERTAEQTSFDPFSAVFDANGLFRAPLTLATGEEQHSTNSILSASDLHSVSSADGYVYVLQASGELDAVSSSGSVEREGGLKPPGEGLSVMQMAAAGSGFLFIDYGHLATGGEGASAQRRDAISVVYPPNGEVTMNFRLPETDHSFSSAACAASTRDFLFLGSDDQGRLIVVHYTPD